MIESLVRGALGQRLVVAVIAAVLFFFGLDAARKLSVDAFPDVTNIQVQIAPVLLAGGYNLCYPVFRFYPLALKRAKLLRSATAMFVPVSFSLDSWSTLSSLHPA